MSLFSASILLFLVMDPFGNAPIFVYILHGVPEERRQKVMLRELIIALIVIVLFLFSGHYLLEALHISEPALRIAGGIILFLIALKMVFGSPEDIFRGWGDEEPLVVPLAIPCIAGPSAIATVMLLMAQEADRWLEWFFALVSAWLATSVILLLSAKFDRILGKRGLSALQHLMGLILTALAVEMFLQGLSEVFVRSG